MKTPLMKATYLRVLADVGLVGITPRELYERSDLLGTEKGAKHSSPLTTISMFLHRLESRGLAVGIPEGKTRRYYLIEKGRKCLDYHELMRLKQKLLPVVNADAIRMNRDLATEIKQNHEKIAEVAVSLHPPMASIFSVRRLPVNAFADLVCKTLDSIELPRDEKTAQSTVRLCRDILAELQMLENQASLATLILSALHGNDTRPG